MSRKNATTLEQPVIRPPSEWRSTLVRITRGCNWNRCRFCGIYPHLGEPTFSLRSFAEIAREIEFLHQHRPQAEEFFLGDADPLHAGSDLVGRVIEMLYQRFPAKKVTSYARVSTLKKLGRQAIQKCADQGLTRIHLGLESGDEKVLRFQRKGQSPAMVREVSGWLRSAGIEQSFYVLLGLGGLDRWRQHITATAELLNELQPDFVRIRRLWLFEPDSVSGQPGCPLLEQVENGSFIPQSAEGTVAELALLLDSLHPSPTYLTCDHANNVIQVHGSLATDLEAMRREVHAFLELPDQDRHDRCREHRSRI
ncbi:MAG: radical SAM protein [Desulfofustis sp.]|nr:radical SAM protein [Desulfofustis sp.]